MSAIEKIHRFSLRFKELSALTEVQLSALSVIQYAVSELNALQRTYIFAAQDLCNQEDVDWTILIQRYTILRIWSAKIFEFSEFLVNCEKESKGDETLRQLATESAAEFESLKDEEAYTIVRIIRNEATNHYSLSAAKKNLSHVSDDANCSLFIHEMVGNSYFPMGEEVMFAGRLNRFGASKPTREERIKSLDTWMKWNLIAMNWIVSVQNSFVKELIFKNFPDRFATTRTCWIPESLAASENDSQVPVFYRRPTQ